jgi:hypothetical protein
MKRAQFSLSFSVAASLLSASGNLVVVTAARKQRHQTNPTQTHRIASGEIQMYESVAI